MCGRYYMERLTWGHLKDDFPGIDGQFEDEFTGDIVPSARAVSLLPVHASTIAAVPLIWGFPGFEKGKLLINARSESIREKPSFSESIGSRRCVLPAAGFYEWDRDRQKCTCTVAGVPVLYLAGIWRPFDQEKRFVIITKEANASMRPVHDRMPLIIAPDDVREWLVNPDRTDGFLAQEDPELTAVVRSRQLHIYRNGKKILVLAGKSAPKIIREDTLLKLL